MLKKFYYLQAIKTFFLEILSKLFYTFTSSSNNFYSKRILQSLLSFSIKKDMVFHFTERF